MFLEGGAKSLPFNLVWLDWFGLEWDEMDHQKDIRRENEEEYENVLEEWLLLADHVVQEEEDNDHVDGKKEKEKNDHPSNVLEDDLKMSMDFFGEKEKCVGLGKWKK